MVQEAHTLCRIDLLVYRSIWGIYTMWDNKTGGRIISHLGIMITRDLQVIVKWTSSRLP